MSDYESESRSDRTDPSAVIVQVPTKQRQRFYAALKQRDVTLAVDVRNERGSPGIHPLRRRDFQAEQTLAFAAEVAHSTGSAGLAIVFGASHGSVCVMMAVHRHTGTELNCWNHAESADAIAFVLSLLERWSQTAPEIPGVVCQSRFSINRSELLSDAAEDRTLWLLSHDRRFRLAETTDVAGVLSGSFHPLHVGHRKLREAARALLGQSIVYEMTLQNADKPPLDWLTLSLRSRQFTAGELLLTRVPTFVEKAELLPGTTFVIGWDTAVRVLERRFYPDGRLESALEKIAERGCRFLVAARRYENRLRTLEELTIPARFRDLFSAIPPELFEEDISSTAIREAWLRGESETGPPGLFTDFFEND